VEDRLLRGGDGYGFGLVLTVTIYGKLSPLTLIDVSTQRNGHLICHTLWVCCEQGEKKWENKQLLIIMVLWRKMTGLILRISRGVVYFILLGEAAIIMSYSALNSPIVTMVGEETDGFLEERVMNVNLLTQESWIIVDVG